MLEESDDPRSDAHGAQPRPRRELLRLPLQALGSWLALRTLVGCAPDDDPGRARETAADGGPPIRTPTNAGPAQADPPRTVDGGALAAPCAKATSFAPIADDGLRTTATRTNETTTLDWITMGISGAFYQTTLPDTLLGLLRTLGGLRLGYPINLLDHSLQTATRARRAGASDDLVLAALFHHVGMTLSVEGYAELSAAIVRGYVSEDTYRIIRFHPEYAAAHFGAQSSVSTDQRARYASQTFHADAVRLADDWERLAYDPSYPSLPLSEFEPLIRERFSTLTSELYTTHGDCI